MVSGMLTPDSVIFTGNYLFVVSDNPVDSVREYNSTGTFIRTVAKSNLNSTIGISAILFDGSNLWTANYSNNTVAKYPL